MASLIFLRAFFLVSPWLMAAGSSTHCTVYPPSSAASSTTVNFTVSSLANHRAKGIYSYRGGVNRHVTRMARMGVLRLERQGMSVRCYIVERTGTGQGPGKIGRSG